MKTPRWFRWEWAAAILLSLFAANASAQPVPSRAPDSTHIYPAGGRRGATVKVGVGAECLPPGAEFLLFGKGLSAPARLEQRIAAKGEPSPRRLPTEVPISYPKQWASEIRIDKSAPLGAAAWRLSSAQGGTTARPFIVGDLPEHLEKESNSAAAKAERVAIPVTINGQVFGERDMDYFRFSLSSGELAVAEVFAGRLGSRLDPLVEFTDLRGKIVKSQTHFVGSDPVLALRAPADGDYLLRVSNVSVHGSPAHVYRINLTKKPFIRFARPAGGRAGETREVELFAIGDDRPLRRKIRFPERPGVFRHDDPSLANPVTLYAESGGARWELESTDKNASSLIKPGESVYGRFGTSTDADVFRFSAKKDQPLFLTCGAFPVGSVALPVVEIRDAGGKVVAAKRSVESADGVCRIEWRPPADGEFSIRARDLRFGAVGGPMLLYRLSLQYSKPDFSLSLASDVVNVRQGSLAEIPLRIERRGGASGPIELEIEGLPKNVKPKSLQVPAAATQFKISLQTDDETVSRSSVLRIIGRAKVGESMIERVALARHGGVDSEGVAVDRVGTERFHLTVQHKPVFRLFCAEAYLYAHRGSIFPYPMTIERQNGFEGEIHLQTGDRQNRDLDGISMVPTTVAPDQTELFMPIYLPESMHINVQSQSQLYTQAYARFKDKQGRPQSVLVVSEKRNMLRTRPPVAKLNSALQQVEAAAGQEFQVLLRLNRTSNFPGPMRVAVETADHKGFQAEPMVIAAGQEEGVIQLAAPSDLRRGQRVRITFRGRGDLDGASTIVSETTVIVVGK